MSRRQQVSLRLCLSLRRSARPGITTAPSLPGRCSTYSASCQAQAQAPLDTALARSLGVGLGAPLSVLGHGDSGGPGGGTRMPGRGTQGTQGSDSFPKEEF